MFPSLYTRVYINTYEFHLVVVVLSPFQPSSQAPLHYVGQMMQQQNNQKKNNFFKMKIELFPFVDLGRKNMPEALFLIFYSINLFYF